MIKLVYHQSFFLGFYNVNYVKLNYFYTILLIITRYWIVRITKFCFDKVSWWSFLKTFNCSNHHRCYWDINYTQKTIRGKTNCGAKWAFKKASKYVLIFFKTKCLFLDIFLPNLLRKNKVTPILKFKIILSHKNQQRINKELQKEQN